MGIAERGGYQPVLTLRQRVDAGVWRTVRKRGGFQARLVRHKSRHTSMGTIANHMRMHKDDAHVGWCEPSRTYADIFP